MSVVEPIAVLWFPCSGIRSPLSPLLCFISVLIICVSLSCFTDEVEDPLVGGAYIFVSWSASALRARFRASKTGSFPTDRSNVVPLLQFFFVVRRWFHM